MRNLFQYYFEIPNVETEFISVTVYAEDTEQAVKVVDNLDLPIGDEDLRMRIKHILQVTDEEETAESN